MGAGLLIAVLGPLYLSIIAPAAAAVAVPGREPLRPERVWVREPDAAVDWRPVIHGATRELTVTYRDGDATVTQFTALYALPARGSPLTRTVNSIADPEDWRTAKTGRVAASLGGAPLTVNTATLVRQQSPNRIVWWFYVVDGRVTASAFEARLLQARTALRGTGHFGALVAISTEADDPIANNPTLARFLAAIGPLPGIQPASPAK